MSTRAQPVLLSHVPEKKARRTRDEALWPLLLGFGAAKVLLQIAVTLLGMRAGFGMFRDEFYYLVCGHRLAAGYVDQPPLVAIQARLSELLFGYHHLVAFRVLPYLAGALTVMLTGLIADALGGTRRAVGLAMLFVLTVPVLVATQSFLSMNAWDPVFWMAMVLAMLHLLAVPEALGWWVLLGVGAGLGLENKASAMFLIAALLLALAATPARHLLRRRGFLLAAGITVLLALPNLWWQVAHGFPTWEWLQAVRHSDKDVLLSPARFAMAQVLMLSPIQLIVWLPGVLWLLFGRMARPWRSAGMLYVFFVLIMLALHAKDYYLAPIYPLCFAAGAVFWTEWAGNSTARHRLVTAGAAVVTLSIVITVPFAVPLLSPSQYVRYSRFMRFAPIESEQHTVSPLPEFYADELGWQQLTDTVSRVYHALPLAEQRQTKLFAGNYGQASALNILGRPMGLPVAISGHQNYWMWGAHGYTGKEMIVVTEAPLSSMLILYRTCRVAATQTSPYTMPWEQVSIYVCHDRRKTYAESWPAVKLYR
jgi:hypothetical protein